MSSSPPAPPPSSHQDKSKNTWFPAVVLALATALNVPPAIIAITSHFVTQHPWWSLLILLGFAIFDLSAYIIARLWQRLEGPLLDKIAQLIDYKIQDWFSGYKKRYCEFLEFQHRDFDLRGVGLQGTYALELDQAFIELSLDLTTIDDISANSIPQNIPQELREGSHSIWRFLTSDYLAKRHLVIIGPPGSGKTTLLKHVTLTLLTAGKHRHRQHKLPILLFLREHANDIHISTIQASTIHIGIDKGESDFTLVDALHNHLKRRGQPYPPAGWIKRQLDSGRCLISLDGLDEVADTHVRKEVVAWVEKQIMAFRENRFIITSRPYGFRENPLSGM